MHDCPCIIYAHAILHPSKTTSVLFFESFWLSPVGIYYKPATTAFRTFSLSQVRCCHPGFFLWQNITEQILERFEASKEMPFKLKAPQKKGATKKTKI